MNVKSILYGDTPNSEVKQAFYMSKQFMNLQIETMDIRMHPVLGGISSTRWNAYRRFNRVNQSLMRRLSNDEFCKFAIKITKRTDQKDHLVRKDLGILETNAKNFRLQSSGMVSGDDRKNLLRGSRGADILIGNGGKDRLTGLGGGDLLSGGRGADRFIFKLRTQQELGLIDTITDFNGNQGDRIKLNGAKSFKGSNGFSGQSGEVYFMSWIVDLVPGSKFNPAIHQGGMISADYDGDKIADLMIELPGVVTIDSEWILLS